MDDTTGRIPRWAGFPGSLADPTTNFLALHIVPPVSSKCILIPHGVLFREPDGDSLLETPTAIP